MELCWINGQRLQVKNYQVLLARWRLPAEKHAAYLCKLKVGLGLLGGWAHLSSAESERRTFTQFRASVNKAISPHEIEHIDFINEKIDK
jgi:hypothetical protein